MENYCVLVKCSKESLTFWYQIEGKDLAPLQVKGDHVFPLYFYTKGEELIMGKFARERYLVNDPDVFTNYFDCIKDTSKTFTLFGDKKPLKQLLLYGVEHNLIYFLKDILSISDSIVSLREKYCLRFWFEEDLLESEKEFVLNLFKEGGYENVDEINIGRHLNKILDGEIITQRARLVLSVISNILIVRLFSMPDHKFEVKTSLKGLGVDPRANILATLMLEDIKESSPHIFIDFDKDVPYIIDHCYKLLPTLSPIMQNEVELSSGVKTSYKIKRSQLEERLVYNRDIEDKVIPRLQELLHENKLDATSTDIVLISEEINTEYFKDKLLKKFSHVTGLDSKIQNKILKSVFSEISKASYKISQKADTLSPTLNVTQPNEKNEIDILPQNINYDSTQIKVSSKEGELQKKGEVKDDLKLNDGKNELNPQHIPPSASTPKAPDVIETKTEATSEKGKRMWDKVTNDTKQEHVPKIEPKKSKLVPLLLGVAIIGFLLFQVYQKFGVNSGDQGSVNELSAVGEDIINGSDQSQTEGGNSGETTGAFSVEFANLSGGNIFIAIGYFTEDWESEGWFELAPNNSKTFNLPENFNQSKVFLFGTNANDDLLWNADDIYLCIDPDKKFHLYNHKNCEFLEGFKEFNLTGEHTIIEINGMEL